MCSLFTSHPQLKHLLVLKRIMFFGMEFFWVFSPDSCLTNFLKKHLLVLKRILGTVFWWSFSGVFLQIISLLISSRNIFHSTKTIFFWSGVFPDYFPIKYSVKVSLPRMPPVTPADQSNQPKP